MNALLRPIMLGAVVVAATACASTQEPTAASSRPIAQPVNGSVMDAEYVATVEYIARNRGVTVRWINPPMKRVATVASK